MELARSLAARYDRHRFTVLFVALILAIAGHGFLGSLLAISNPFEWLLGASLLGVVFSARGRLRWILSGLALGAAAGRLAQGLDQEPLFVSESLVAFMCLLAAGVAVRRALASGPVDVEHISAALAAYLLAGIAFGVLYFLMETALPGSFSSSSAVALTPPRAIYFSFVTQATVGFGDIVPQSEQAQGVVVAQGVGGQMYLAVLVARLVSLYSAQERR